MLTFPRRFSGEFHFMTETLSKKVQHSIAQLMEAWKKQDFEVLNELLHKNFQFVSTGVKGYKYNKMQWLDVAVNKYKIHHYRTELLDLKETDSLVISLSKLSLLSSISFNDQYSTYLVTDVWKNEHGNWKLLMRQPVLIG